MAQARRIMRHFILILLLLLHACLSTREQKQREFQQAPLFGMVYDYDQKPCPGAAILVDGQPRGQTDINGRFVVNDLARGEHRVGVRKPGFEEQDADFEFRVTHATAAGTRRRADREQ